MQYVEEKIIELSRGKILLLIAGAILFVALGAWLLGEEYRAFEGDHGFNDPFILAVSIICIVFFGLCAGVGFKKLFDKTPGLILNHEGFIDNSSGIAAGRILWSEVTGIGQYQVQRTKFVAVYLRNPEIYVNRGNALKRMINRANLKLSGTPINISSNSLKIGFNELLELFEKYYLQGTSIKEQV